jgi:isopentenyl diphosphate isomerase/L-lactate dehydrogenase-like FMN-dependent dehydrogenase
MSADEASIHIPIREATRSLRSVADYELWSREVLPTPLFDTLFGTYDSPGFETNTHNIEAFKRLRLRPRVLTGAGSPCLETTALGAHLPFPVMIAPLGILQRVHPQAELAVAQAAGEVGTVMAVSTASSFSIEELAEVATAPLWFQLYFYRDREINKMLVQRAERAGYAAIVVTVDKLTKSRERDYGVMDPVIHTLDTARLLKNLADVGNVDLAYEPKLSWSDLEWRGVTRLPIVVKGIQAAEDAALCAQHGMDGLVVSNHGGHVVRATIATMEALPEIVEAAGGALEVYLDSGVRHGTDVLKALALGARAVLVGRAVFWGLTLGGKDGVRAVLEILRDELYDVAGHCGVSDVSAVTPRLVYTRG